MDVSSSHGLTAGKTTRMHGHYEIIYTQVPMVSHCQPVGATTKSG